MIWGPLSFDVYCLVLDKVGEGATKVLRVTDGELRGFEVL